MAKVFARLDQLDIQPIGAATGSSATMSLDSALKDRTIRRAEELRREWSDQADFDAAAEKRTKPSTWADMGERSNAHPNTNDNTSAAPSAGFQATLFDTQDREQATDYPAERKTSAVPIAQHPTGASDATLRRSAPADDKKLRVSTETNPESRDGSDHGPNSALGRKNERKGSGVLVSEDERVRIIEAIRRNNGPLGIPLLEAKTTIPWNRLTTVVTEMVRLGALDEVTVGTAKRYAIPSGRRAPRS